MLLWRLNGGNKGLCLACGKSTLSVSYLEMKCPYPLIKPALTPGTVPLAVASPTREALWLGSRALLALNFPCTTVWDLTHLRINSLVSTSPHLDRELSEDSIFRSACRTIYLVAISSALACHKALHSEFLAALLSMPQTPSHKPCLPRNCPLLP